MDALAPVNVAKPDWACPYCGTTYGDELECAKKCAALGPAAEGAAERIAVLTHTTRFTPNPRDGLRVVTLDKVKLDGPKFNRWGDRDEKERRHVQTYSDGTVADVGVGYVDGTLVELGTPRERGSNGLSRRDGVDTFNDVAGLARSYSSSSYGKRNGLRIVSHRRSTFDGGGPVGWLGPVTAAAAAAFEVLTPGAWERLRDVEKRNEIIKGHRLGDRQTHWRGWVTGHRSDSSGWRAPGTTEIAAVAATHGFEWRDTAGMSRWEFAHRDAIDDALWERACAWVDRDGATVMVRPQIGVSVKQSGYGGELPKAPGKKRVAALEHWGVEYHGTGDDRWYSRVLEVVLASLAVPAPTDPVIPGVPTATEFTARMSRKARP